MVSCRARRYVWCVVPGNSWDWGQPDYILKIYKGRVWHLASKSPRFISNVRKCLSSMAFKVMFPWQKVTQGEARHRYIFHPHNYSYMAHCATACLLEHFELSDFTRYTIRGNITSILLSDQWELRKPPTRVVNWQSINKTSIAHISSICQHPASLVAFCKIIAISRQKEVRSYAPLCLYDFKGSL